MIADDLRVVLDQMAAACRRMRDEGPQVLADAEAALPDGYRRSVRPVATSSGDVSDPVGRTVELLPAAVFRARRMERHLLAALGELHLAARELEAEKLDPDLDGCVSCARFGIWSKVDRAGRCWPCYRWRLRSPDGRTDPPERLVRERQWTRAERQMARRVAGGTG